MALSFALLGPLQVRRDGQPVELGSAKQRAVLAVLLTTPDRVVPVSRLVDAVWGGAAGAKAESTLQAHVSGLRRALGPDAALLVTRPPGYVLTASEQQTDLGVARALREQGRAAVARGDPAGAARAFGDALALWRGRPLGDLQGLPFAEEFAVSLEEERLSLLEQRIDADLGCGRSAELIGELQGLTRAHPLHERFWARLVLALYRTGRQAEALSAYGTVARTMREELGLEPGQELQALQRRVLAQDPGLTTGTGPRPASTVRVSPAQAPRGVLVRPGGERVALDGRRLVIGRHPDCGLVLDDLLTSREHAEVVVAAGLLTVVDLHSTNGTRVNGDPVERHPLRPGDEIQIGETVLRFEGATTGIPRPV